MRKAKIGKNTQKCLIFRNRKSVKRGKPRKTGPKQGIQSTVAKHSQEQK